MLNRFPFANCGLHFVHAGDFFHAKSRAIRASSRKIGKKWEASCQNLPSHESALLFKPKSLRLKGTLLTFVHK